MLELMKKAALASVGFASLTSEKVEELANDLIVKGKMTELEGRKFVDELKAKAAESRESMKQQTDSAVDKALGKLNLAHADEVKVLKDEIAAMKEELAALKK
jgi:polyhydroxyalkanoate synthesis regulator phasin